MNNKIAQTKHPVIDLIKNRWSARSYSDKKISQDDLDTILEAASWSFSSNNAQPWNYIYAHQHDSSFEKLADCLMPGNKPWAKKAAVLIAVTANKKYENGQDYKIAQHDVGAANTTLMLQALSMGVYGHIMGGFDRAKTIELLHLNTEVQEPVVFISLGYLDSPDKLEEPFKQRELMGRTRKSLSEISKHFV